MTFIPISRRLRVATVPLLAACALGGCEGAMSAHRRSPGTIENGAFKPTLPPALNYGPDPSRSCPQRGVYGLVQDQMSDRFKGKAVPQTDGRLCAIAETLLGWQVEGDELPPESVRQFLSSYFGLPTTFRQLLISNIDTEADRQLADALSAPIGTFAESAQVPRYGLVTSRVKKGVTKAALVMQDQNLELSPVPRKLSAGANATLDGRALGTIDKPKVTISNVMGKLETVPGGPDKSFRTQLQCGEKPGKILVQITGESEGADVVLASFPVACGGVELATAVPMPGKQRGASSTDPAKVEQRLLELTNADRSAAGLKPLESDAALAKIARDVSDNRAKGKATSSSELLQAMRDADISAPVILESAVQALDDNDAYTRLSNSPEDRANLMNPDVTQIGVGVAPGAAVGNKPTIIVTGLFVKQLPPPNVEEVKANLYQAISRRRADARSGPVTKDPQLEEIAQAYATEMAKAKGKVPREKVAEIEAPLYKSFATVNEMGGLKADPLEFAEEPGIVGDAKLVGVGVGIGSSPQFGKNSTYVVILMGKKPSAKAPAARQPVKKKK
jgi:uncharacterized protein YkwD